MLNSKRMDDILEILKMKKHVSVEYLSKNVFASTVTIRRDLQKMEEQGLIKRSHGGASLVDPRNKTISYHLSESTMQQEKEFIAKKAVEYINEGDIIFLDASYTALKMIDYMRDGMSLTVITSSIKAAAALCEKSISTYCLGGRLLETSFACVGSQAIKAVEAYNADTMFFSARGVSQDGCITDVSEEFIRLRAAMLARSKKKIFLFDSSKFGKVYMFNICNINEMDAYICDKPVTFQQNDISSLPYSSNEKIRTDTSPSQP